MDLSFDDFHINPLSLVVLAISVVYTTFLIRRTFETAWPALRPNASLQDPRPVYINTASVWWNEVVVMALPVATGAVYAVLAPEFFLNFTPKLPVVIMYGAGVGWLSSFIYRCIRKVLTQKFGIDPGDLPPSDSIKPGPNA